MSGINLSTSLLNGKSLHKGMGPCIMTALENRFEGGHNGLGPPETADLIQER